MCVWFRNIYDYVSTYVYGRAESKHFNGPEKIKKNFVLIRGDDTTFK